MRTILLHLLIALIVVAATPKPLEAYDPDGVPGWPQPAYECNERVRLAQALMEEANVQPDEAHWAVAQIIYYESRSRGMDVCQLLMKTHFLSIWHYAEAHPGGWHWRGFREDPPQWAIEIAATVLLERGKDMRRGSRHFDAVSPCGRYGYVLIFQSGQICFYN